MAKVFQVDSGKTLTTNLQYYAKFDTDANDFSDNNRTGTEFGTPTYGTPAKINNAIGLDSTKSARLNGIPTLNDNSSWSISLWLYLNSYPSTDYTRFASIQGPTTGQFSTAFCMRTSGKIYVQINKTNQVSYQFTSSATLSLSTWYHIVILCDGTQAKLYINNSFDSSATKTISGTANSNGSIGINRDEYEAQSQMNCRIDECGFWNKVLTTTEIADLYNNGNGQTMIEEIPNNRRRLLLSM